MRSSSPTLGTYTEERRIPFASFRGGAWLAVALCLLGLVAGCEERPSNTYPILRRRGAPAPPPVPEKKTDLPQIRERGRLRAITSYSPTSYFIYRGEPMGYEYELVSRFAEHLGLELEIVIAEDLDSILDMLNGDEGDIVAYGLAVTIERAKQVAFSRPLHTTRQVLVQRKPSGWRNMKLHNIEKKLIRDQTRLVGRRVSVRKNSSYYARLLNLSEEIGGDIQIVEADGNTTTAELIRKVAQGEIDLTVADESIATVNASYYSNIDIKTPISFPQRQAWALRHGAPKLLEAVNEWMQHVREEGTAAVLYAKYFRNRNAFRNRASSEFFVHADGGKISRYDSLIKKYAVDLGWDWRLLAAQICQESRFDPTAQSWAGATGLMQLLPETGKAYGAEHLNNPEQNIRAGTSYLQWIRGQFDDIEDRDERIRFVLGAYNAGPGHIFDAQALAQKNGNDPARWEDVAVFLAQLDKPRYFNDPVVRYGYCRGIEPVNYVDQVLDLYHHYQNFFPQPGEAPEEVASPSDSAMSDLVEARQDT